MESSWRARAAFVVLAISTTLTPASTGPVTEADAIRLFLEQSPQARRVPLVTESVDADLRSEARLGNPAITYQIEDAGGVRDEFFTIEQELPITGRRQLLGQRARAAATAAGLVAENRLQRAAYDLKRSFYEIFYRETVLAQLRRGAQRLESMVGILRTREQEGEGSGYDLLRAEQELAELEMTAVQAESDLAAARSRFGAFYGQALKMRSIPIAGDWAPAGPVPDAAEAAELALARRLDLKALSAEQERTDLELRAARRKRLPEPVLTAGWKRTESLGLSDSGYVAALTVPLPVFDRGRLETRRATVNGQRLSVEAEILTRRIRAEVQTAVAREQAARRAARVYGEQIEYRSKELLRVAGLKYDEGEGGILELLDAHRTSLSISLRAIAARYEAKSAEIDRDRAIGNEVKP